MRHVEAAAEYFHSVATARHVVGCTFQEVTASPRDRAAFHVNASRVLETMANERAAPARARLARDSRSAVSGFPVRRDAPRDARGVRGRKRGVRKRVRFGARAGAARRRRTVVVPRGSVAARSAARRTPRRRRAVPGDDRSSSSSSSSRMPKEAGSGNAPELTIDDRTDFETCVREAMAAAATIGKETARAAACGEHAAFAVAVSAPTARLAASRACRGGLDARRRRRRRRCATPGR